MEAKGNNVKLQKQVGQFKESQKKVKLKMHEIFGIISHNTSVEVKPLKTLSKNMTLLKNLIVKLLESLLKVT